MVKDVELDVKIYSVIKKICFFGSLLLLLVSVLHNIIAFKCFYSTTVEYFKEASLKNVMNSKYMCK